MYVFTYTEICTTNDRQRCDMPCIDDMILHLPLCDTGAIRP